MGENGSRMGCQLKSLVQNLFFLRNWRYFIFAVLWHQLDATTVGSGCFRDDATVCGFWADATAQICPCACWHSAPVPVPVHFPQGSSAGLSPSTSRCAPTPSWGGRPPCTNCGGRSSVGCRASAPSLRLTRIGQNWMAHYHKHTSKPDQPYFHILPATETL